MKIRTNTVLLCLIIWFALDTSSHGSSDECECISDNWNDLTCCIARSGHCCTTEVEVYPYPEVTVCLKDSQDCKLTTRCKLDNSSFQEPWSEWAILGGCSVTCGEGMQYRTRNRLWSFAQIEINETAIEEFPCNQTQCPGQWNNWANLGGCSVTCGQGIQHQTRHRFLSCAQKNETVVNETVCDQSQCPVFKWDHLNERNLTFEEKKEMMKHELVEIKANLTVDKKNTSSAIRRRTSAPDHRHSASSFGYVGVILLVLPLVLLVCADCIRCCQPKEKSRKKRICLSKRETGVELTVMELET